jgi:hypothetical protein
MAGTAVSIVDIGKLIEGIVLACKHIDEIVARHQERKDKN